MSININIEASDKAFSEKLIAMREKFLRDWEPILAELEAIGYFDDPEKREYELDLNEPADEEEWDVFV